MEAALVVIVAIVVAATGVYYVVLGRIVARDERETAERERYWRRVRGFRD
jgi:hypothetical protein